MVGVYHIVNGSIAKLDAQELFVKVTLGSRLEKNNQFWFFGLKKRRKLTGTTPYVPSAFLYSATSRFGVEEFPHIMAPFSTSMLIGNKSLNSILGSWDLAHSSAFLKIDGAPVNKEAEPAGVLGGYS